MEIGIQIDKLDVHSVETTSGVFCGENRHSHWSAFKKTNQGLGSVSGQGNLTSDPINIVVDSDLLDMQTKE